MPGKLETQALNFVFEAEVKGFREAQSSIRSSMGQLEEAMGGIEGGIAALQSKVKGGGTGGIMKTAFSGLSGVSAKAAGAVTTAALGAVSAGFIVLGSAVTGLGLIMADVAADWWEAMGALDELRKDTGMTFDEMMEMSDLLIETSAQYGRSMAELGNVVQYVATGGDKAREEMGKLTGDLAEVVSMTGASAKGVAELQRTVLYSMDKTAEGADQTMWALQATAANTGGSFELMAQQFTSAIRNFLLIPKDHRKRVETEMGGLMAALQRVYGPEGVQMASEVLQQFMTQDTPIMRKFVGEGYDVVGLLEMIANEAERLQGRDQDFMIGKFMQENWGLSVNTTQAKKLIEAIKLLRTETENYKTEVGRSSEEIKKLRDEMKTPWQKLSESWNKITAVFKKAINKLIGESGLVEGMEKLAAGVKKVVPILKDLLGPALESVTEFVGGLVHGIINITEAVADFITGSDPLFKWKEKNKGPKTTQPGVTAGLEARAQWAAEQRLFHHPKVRGGTRVPEVTMDEAFLGTDNNLMTRYTLEALAGPAMGDLVSRLITKTDEQIMELRKLRQAAEKSSPGDINLPSYAQMVAELMSRGFW